MSRAVPVVPDESDPSTEPAPEVFRAAVTSLTGTPVRREVRVEPLRAPQKRAPYRYAIRADIVDERDGDVV